MFLRNTWFVAVVSLFSYPMDTKLIEETLGGLLKALDLPFESFAIAEEEGFIRIDIKSNHASRLIGWHGETLNSVQHLLKSLVRAKEKLDRAPFLVLDVDGYRRDQEEKVRVAAQRKADFVRRTGNRIALPPMSPYFRRIVHLYVSNDPGMQDLTTMSTGEGEYRQVVLRLKEEKTSEHGEGELSPVISKEEGSNDGLENLDV